MKYPITPVPKPRMTQSDKWKVRPEVARYRAFCDEVRLRKVILPEAGAHVTFVLPMPPSWPKKKRAALTGKPHQQRGDADNFLKGLMDAIFPDDSSVWDVRITKVWGEVGEIVIDQA